MTEVFVLLVSTANTTTTITISNTTDSITLVITSITIFTYYIHKPNHTKDTLAHTHTN